MWPFRRKHVYLVCYTPRNGHRADVLKIFRSRARAVEYAESFPIVSGDQMEVQRWKVDSDAPLISEFDTEFLKPEQEV